MSKDLISNLIKKVDEASDAYYNSGSPIMSDQEFDEAIETIQEWEEQNGAIEGSPTQRVGAPVLDKIDKVTIQIKPMLSLEKTHSEQDLLNKFNDTPVVAMSKCDGVSTRLYYKKGKLVSAHTRGDGYVGADITEHIKHYQYAPLEIPTDHDYVIDGETVILARDFEVVKQHYPELKNPRNTVAGALNSLDMKEVANKDLTFIAWDVIEEGADRKSLSDKLLDAESLGFLIVPFFKVRPISPEDIETANEQIVEWNKLAGLPCDGVVWKIDYDADRENCKQTAHHFTDALAFKFKDEVYETTLKDIEWTMGRTGALTPVAIFDPVEIDGTEVSRASLHNIDVMEELIGIPYKDMVIQVYKANQIIPQILGRGKQKPIEVAMHLLTPPTECPICGKETAVKDGILYCTNPNCEGKLINKLDHFCGIKGLDIKGLSKATLEKLLEWGWVEKRLDIFDLERHREEWIKKAGFGIKSVDKILNSIKVSSENVPAWRIISSCGIPLIGQTVAKQLAKFCNNDFEEFLKLVKQGFDFSELDGIGDIMSWEIANYEYAEIQFIYENYLTQEEVQEETEQSNDLEGITFVVTGKLTSFKNRNELKDYIESRGGKVASAVSTKTDYLINNNVKSASAKNAKAQDLKIPIITEKEFLEKWKN